MQGAVGVHRGLEARRDDERGDWESASPGSWERHWGDFRLATHQALLTSPIHKSTAGLGPRVGRLVANVQ